ncbi:MAG TPA: acetyl-CoA carboxylase biotin carboxyl carrier protein [Hyphomicrobiaceae bacterium]|nr:acetyl-CoA carboxylase biotin carboxyl carrier protein [Hyphomicrobiaceae bacterium]
MPKDSKDKDAADKGLIRELAELLVETGLSEIEVEREGLKIRVARSLTVAATVPMPMMPAPLPGTAASSAPRGDALPAAGAPAAADPTSHPGCVKSPMVGTAYRAPEPGASPFVDVGTRVNQGQTLLIIEAMKTMNHIPAPRSGTVREVFIENGQPVEYGEALLIIE